MCRKPGEMGLIPTPLNPEAKPWKPTANPVPNIASKKLLNHYYPHYLYHYPPAAGLVYQYPPPFPLPPAVHHHNYHVHDQKKPQHAVSRYNVQHQPYPDRETTQKGYPRGRGKWVVGGGGYARKISGGDGEWKEVVTCDCTMGQRSAGSSKARWSGYNERKKFDMPKNRGRRSVCENGRGQYVPKKMADHSNGGDVLVVSAGTAPAVDDDDAGGGERTTVMIRNIPNKFRSILFPVSLLENCLVYGFLVSF